MRRQAIAVLAALAALHVACDAGEPSVEPTTSASASPDVPATDGAVVPDPDLGAAPGAVLVDEDFTTGPGAFFTDRGGDFEVSIGDGQLQVFIEGRGTGDPNILRERVDVPAAPGGLAVEVTIDLIDVVGEGSGGYGIRCYAGDDYYLFFWDLARADGTPPEAAILSQRGEQFQVLASRDQPAGLIGSDRRARFRAQCDDALADDATELTFEVEGVEVLTATDDPGLSVAFDGIAVGGEWTGERVEPSTLTNGRAGGLSFAVDDVSARAL